MKDTIIISLVGEQPIPNLLALLYARPKMAAFVLTERTKEVYERLCSVLKLRGVEWGMMIEDEPIEVDPYNLPVCERKIKRFLEEKGWSPDGIVFNLTGGTKPMALAAYRLAEQLSCPFLYIESEGKKSVVYHYRFSDGLKLEKRDEVPLLIDIDFYLRAHLADYHVADFHNEFEKMIYGVLSQELDEVKHSVKPLGGLEIDLVLRCGNRVGIAETKTRKKAQSKEGIEQIITAAEQRFLGTYTKKFLIIDREYEPNNFALARAHGITVVELPSAQSGELSREDTEKLIQTVKKELGG
ncbi:type II-like restriction endonuclease [Thermacetogenium phaeum DSM 12270]|uniref:Type II-like restriction endonuclease n=1 Tax=Thermacetogenium phaeum (strain ATCC BAA-254 / DSM 26808 / PB) TaxID=1089553 RepID=K4LXC8_THEPS|nr:DUF1887 family CARF protein [Thermacetogenium phaeum]AFV12634.1 type II-like restriction endonuclease [Thermacetogenium phaeum DSM 12270]